jgi:hypothetical protein
VIIPGHKLSVNTTTIDGSYELYVSGDIGATGNIVAYVSDRRLKENIRQIEHPIDMLKSITGYSFDWNKLAVPNKRGKRELGLIADEVEELMPELISKFMHPDEAINQGAGVEEYKAVLYDRLAPVMVEAIKQQQTEIDALKERVEIVNRFNIVDKLTVWLHKARTLLGKTPHPDEFTNEDAKKIVNTAEPDLVNRGTDIIVNPNKGDK